MHGAFDNLFSMIFGGFAVLCGAAGLVFMVYISYKTYKVNYKPLTVIFSCMTVLYSFAYYFSLRSYLHYFFGISLV